MLVREADIGDVPAIARIAVDTWQTAYRGIIADVHLDDLSYAGKEKSLARLFAARNIVVLIAGTVPGTPVGFAVAGPERSGNPVYTEEIQAMYVLRKHQRRGAGRLLFAAARERPAGGCRGNLPGSPAPALPKANRRQSQDFQDQSQA